jgi:2-iminobutanoate/2-iminopropanoate deaminase
MKRIIKTDKAPQAIGPYSQAIETDQMLFISGQIPLNPESGEIEGMTISEQTKRVLSNIEAILESAGYGIKHVVKTTCMLADINDFTAMNEVYSMYFNDVLPARSTFGVSALPKGVKIEIDVIAKK